jgi:hypothetical protein
MVTLALTRAYRPLPNRERIEGMMHNTILLEPETGASDGITAATSATIIDNVYFPKTMELKVLIHGRSFASNRT